MVWSYGGNWKMKKPDWRIWVKDKKECRIWLENYLKKGVLKKAPKEHELYIKKADHNLNLALWLYEKHNKEIPSIFGKETFYDWVISMHYYSIYHAALALLSREGYESKGHSPTLCFLISVFYHKQKLIDAKDIEIVANSLGEKDIEIIGFSKEIREKASYNIHEHFEKKLAENVKEDAVEFVNKVKVLLK